MRLDERALCIDPQQFRPGGVVDVADISCAICRSIIRIDEIQLTPCGHMFGKS